MTIETRRLTDKEVKAICDHQVFLAARSAGKSALMMDLTKQRCEQILEGQPPRPAFHELYGARATVIITDNWAKDISPARPDADLPDWKNKIPDPNPFNRAFSSPSEKARAKARAKRKKR